MNRERDIERVLDAWLEAGPTVMPDRVFDGVLDRVERQPQRRLARLQQRFFPMRPSMILAAAAAIAIAVGAGVVLLGRPATPDVAAPSVAPSVAPTPTAIPSPSPLGVVPAGTYVSSFLDVRSEPTQVQSAGAFGQLRYTVPDGWANMHDRPGYYSLIPAADYAGPAGEPTGDRTTWHDLAVLARPAPAELCSLSSASSAAVSAADLAAYVAGHPALEATAPAPVAVGSLTGTMIDVRVRDDWTGTCPDLDGDTVGAQLLASREGGGWYWGINKGERMRLIFVDIGGGATVMIGIGDNISAARFDELVAAAMPVIATFEFPEPE